MQAIRTKCIGPSNFKPSRIVASAEAGRKIISWDHALDQAENHTRAAELFARSFGWSGTFFGGGYGYSYYWICVPYNPDATPRFSIAGKTAPRWSFSNNHEIVKNGQPFAHLINAPLSPQCVSSNTELIELGRSIVEALNVLGVSR